MTRDIGAAREPHPIAHDVGTDDRRCRECDRHRAVHGDEARVLALEDPDAIGTRGVVDRVVMRDEHPEREPDAADRDGHARVVGRERQRGRAECERTTHAARAGERIAQRGMAGEHERVREAELHEHAVRCERARDERSPRDRGEHEIGCDRRERELAGARGVHRDEREHDHRAAGRRHLRRAEAEREPADGEPAEPREQREPGAARDPAGERRAE